MEGQAPPTAAAAPERLIIAEAGQLPPPPPPPLVAEGVVAPDTVESGPLAVAEDDLKAPPPPPLDAEDVSLVVPEVDPTSLPPPLEAEDVALVVPEADLTLPHPPPLDSEDEAAVVPEADLAPSLPPSLEAEDVALVVPEAVDAAALVSSEAGAGGVVLTDELRDQIVKQVEYYFSDENLPTDEFMLKFVKKNKQGFVPLGIVASFRRMKKLVQDLSIIEAALRTSSKLVVSPDGKRIRRLHLLPSNETKDVNKRTVVVENLPSDFSVESINSTFGTVGKIIKVTVHDPHSVGESETSKKPDFMLSSKVHALVEYEAVEAAEKAATTLNDERNWRTGMKVRLVAKRNVAGAGKHNQSSKEHQEMASKKNKGQPSKEEQQTILGKNGGADSGDGSFDTGNVNSAVTDEDMHPHQNTNTKGGRKGRYRAQGKGQIQQNTSGRGHGSSLAISGSDSVNKPIPGPRMPDGTRGFAVGRGKSLPFQKCDKAEE